MPPVDSAPAGPNPVFRPARRGNYFARHWRGELSLPVSYFVNGVGLSLASIALSQMVLSRIDLPPWPGLIFVAGVWLLAIALTVWQAVGIWRAAGNHIDRTGRVFWAGAARVLVTIGLISGGLQAINIGLPVLREHVKIVQGDVELGGFELRVLNQGREIGFSGAIVHGAAEALRLKLREAPQARILRLDSHGGRVAEARAMQRVVRDARLDTYVPARCLSACTVVFAGGAGRHADGAARIGFHAASIDGVSDAEMIEENLRTVEDMVRLGIDRAFATRAWLTPSSGMWYPSFDEMKRARFVTAAADGRFALAPMRVDRQYVIDFLRESPSYRAIAEHEPEVFARLVDAGHQAMTQGRSADALTAELQAHLVPLTKKYLLHASDETLLLYGRVLVAQMRLIGGRKGALACHAYVAGEASAAADILSNLTPEAQRDYQRLAEQAVITGTAHAGALLPQAQIDELMDRLWERLLQRQPPSFLDEMQALDNGTGDPNRSCALLDVFYSAILELPPPQAAAVLRYLVAP